MARTKLISVALSLLMVLAGCGGSSGESDSQPSSPPPQPSLPPPPPPPPPQLTMPQAFQLLNQASFGATEDEAQVVIDLGVDEWIDRQLQQAPSLQLPHLRSLPLPQPVFLLHPERIDIWFRNVVNGPDQLRQRVAFALSEILVVSQLGALDDLPFAVADYHDMLARNAFGNYRQLLHDVTLHPAMGVYLSMLGNEKPDAAVNIRPDENYARELMQLFSIGLVELNLDGTVVRDAQNQPVPTYNQQIIEGFAHVYTGWHFAGATSFDQARPNDFNQTVPMQLYPSKHDLGEKELLNGVVLPPGQMGDKDLADALDNIFNHPNVGPFVSIRLIQRLVTSNPHQRTWRASQAYSTTTVRAYVATSQRSSRRFFSIRMLALIWHRNSMASSKSHCFALLSFGVHTGRLLPAENSGHYLVFLRMFFSGRARFNPPQFSISLPRSTHPRAKSATGILWRPSSR